MGGVVGAGEEGFREAANGRTIGSGGRGMGLGGEGMKIMRVFVGETCRHADVVCSGYLDWRPVLYLLVVHVAWELGCIRGC